MHLRVHRTSTISPLQAHLPIHGLDALTRERMQEELRRLWQVTRATVVFVTHSVDEAAYLGTRVLATRDRIMAVVREAQRGSTEG